ncbi:MAG: NFACT family protein, partial [Eubacteriales bacterium]
DTAAILRQKTHDIHTAVSGNRAKLAKKLNILKKELADCDEMGKYKRFGDLITASAYMLKQKAKFADVPDYYSCDGDKIETVRIPLDEKLTPSQNAARYYKKYTKLKTAKEILAEQIKIAETDLEYLASVEVAVSLCESEADTDEIRRELILGGYLRQASEKGNPKPVDKHMPKPARFLTSGGRELICGRNNIQNDYVSMKLARKHDWWFHVKNSAGAHVIMLCEQGEEPDARDFTEAAELAAYYSSISDTQNAAVDYTLVKNLKKPSGAKPGKVVYYSNYTAYVTPKLSAKKL